MTEARAVGTAVTTASITAARSKLRSLRRDNIGTSSQGDRQLVQQMLHQMPIATASIGPLCANFNRVERSLGIRILSSEESKCRVELWSFPEVKGPLRPRSILDCRSN